MGNVSTNLSHLQPYEKIRKNIVINFKIDRKMVQYQYNSYLTKPKKEPETLSESITYKH